MTAIRSFNSLAQASATAITFEQLNLETSPAIRPEVIAVIGQPADSKESGLTENTPILSDGTTEQAFSLFGASPLYYAAEKLFPKSGDGAKVPVYFVPVFASASAVQAQHDSAYTYEATESFTAYLTFREIPSAASADAVGKIATNAQLDPSRAPRGIKLDGFNTNAIPFDIKKVDNESDITEYIIAAVNAEIDAPFTASTPTGADLRLTAKWAGDSGNYFEPVVVNADGDEIFGASFSLGTAGSGTFNIETALDNLTESYGVTRIVNQFDDTTNLDLVQEWGEGKRNSLVSQYAIAYCGRGWPESATVAGTIDVTAVAALGDARLDDAVNSVLYGNYGDLRELEWSQRDTLLKAGITNVEYIAGTATLMDCVTFYHPVGVSNPIYMYDDSITKEGNLAYDLRAFFAQDDWMSKTIVSVDSKTTNPNAIDINDFAAAINGRAELWEKVALIASAAFVKENSVYSIDDLNPRRINANVKAQLTSTLRIADNTLYLGFLFGESA